MTTYGLSRDLMPRRKIATPVSEVRTVKYLVGTEQTGGNGKVPLGHEMTKTWHTHYTLHIHYQYYCLLLLFHLAQLSY